MVTEEDAALEKAARLGAPSWVWRAGQQRRLDLVRRSLPLEGRRILDIGCGVGMYLRAFQRYSPSVLGLEVDQDRAGHASAIAPVLQARAESLPLPHASLHVVFVNSLPDQFRARLVPHARAYTWTDLRRTFEGLPLRIVHHGYVYPGFDNVKARSPFLADVLRRVLYALEHTPLRVFGLSHFLVLERL